MSTGDIKRSDSGLRVQVGLAVERQTPNTKFGELVQSGVSKATDVVLKAGELAAPFVPGGAIVSAAVTGLSSMKSAMTNSVAVAPNAVQLSGGQSIASSGTAAASSAGTSGVFNQVEAQAATGDSSAVMMQATRELQEMNQSFNLQYLQLQQKMQADTRQFTALSNIMKAKHDAAKNSINNVR